MAEALRTGSYSAMVREREELERSSGPVRTRDGCSRQKADVLTPARIPCACGARTDSRRRR